MSTRQATLFAQIAARLSRPEQLHGVTIFVPLDDAFVDGIDTWEPACWGVHLINGDGQAKKAVPSHGSQGLILASGLQGPTALESCTRRECSSPALLASETPCASD
eukprot:scaffold70_cov242-Pinguiococcus_pyrenoidosus.AAC.8